jgi:TorA maturation chaperone TorD
VKIDTFRTGRTIYIIPTKETAFHFGTLIELASWLTTYGRHI